MATLTQPVLALERHYSPAEIAELWGLSVESVRRLFDGEDGVLVFGETEGKFRRRYTTLRIPESVVERVHRSRSRGVCSGRGRE
jgi:hypothetical protein